MKAEEYSNNAEALLDNAIEKRLSDPETLVQDQSIDDVELLYGFKRFIDLNNIKDIKLNWCDVYVFCKLMKSQGYNRFDCSPEDFLNSNAMVKEFTHKNDDIICPSKLCISVKVWEIFWECFEEYMPEEKIKKISNAFKLMYDFLRSGSHPHDCNERIIKTLKVYKEAYSTIEKDAIHWYGMCKHHILNGYDVEDEE